MSLGQRTLCDILAAFLHDPGVVFLDEPTIGLDVAMKDKIRDLIRTLNQVKKTTIILTTHDMGDVDALCKRIVIIDKGKMIYDNSIDNLTKHFGSYRTLSLSLTARQETMNETAMQRLIAETTALLTRSFPHVDFRHVSCSDGYVEILLNEKDVSVVSVLNAMQTQFKIYDMHLKEITTESVIRKIYEGQYA